MMYKVDFVSDRFGEHTLTVVGPKSACVLVHQALETRKDTVSAIMSDLNGEVGLDYDRNNPAQAGKNSQFITRKVKADTSNLEVVSGKNAMIALDKTLTPELIGEGFAQGFKASVQSFRKEMDLDLNRRIYIMVFCDDEAVKYIEDNRDYLKTETLALGISVISNSLPVNGRASPEWHSTTCEIEGKEVEFAIKLAE